MEDDELEYYPCLAPGQDMFNVHFRDRLNVRPAAFRLRLTDRDPIAYTTAATRRRYFCRILLLFVRLRNAFSSSSEAFAVH